MRHAAITKALGIHPLIAVDVVDEAARLALVELPNETAQLAATPIAPGHCVDQGGRIFVLRALPATNPLNWAEIITNPASREYVDAVAQGLDVKASVRTAALSNIALSGFQTVSGVSLVDGDRVLPIGQSSAQQNGIYVVRAGAWVRAPDADSSAKVTGGMYTLVTEGAQAGYGYVLTTPDPIVLGTTPLTFSLFSGAGLANQVQANTAAIATKADRLIVSVTYTDLARTLQLSDAGKSIGINTATDSQYTVPPGVFTVGDTLFGIQLGAGRIQFLEGAGVIIVGTSKYSRTQGSPWALYQRSLNNWELTGDLVG